MTRWRTETIGEGLGRSDADAHQPAESGREGAPSMVELVARAICCPSGFQCGITLFGKPKACDSVQFHCEAVDVLRAMREPTDAMRAAGWAAGVNAPDIYTAMIDAALAPDGGLPGPVHSPKPNPGEV